MQTVGVICEYNPFHLGHARQLAAVRQQLGGDTAVVCLMSGNYVQRGEPAVFDKRVRARGGGRGGGSCAGAAGHGGAAVGRGLRRRGACGSYPRLAAGI